MATSTDHRDRLIYTLDSVQRKALVSNDPMEYESALGTMLGGIRETYDHEGLVLIRGLLDEDSLNRLCDDGQAVADAVKLGSNFTSLKFGPIFSFQSADPNEPVDGAAFREAALTSAIPAFIAKVLLRLQDDDSNSPLRLLKDAFMAKGKEKKHCGWHVDDAGFWPCNSQSNGVNVWVALDDMPEMYGGAMAVSPKSHNAEWRQHAYEAIGSTKTFPPEGIGIDSPLLGQVFGKTCNMEGLDPALNACIESSKVEFDYQKGDCLFCTRWLFHRSVELTDEGLEHYDDDLALKRYTVRYERGTARLMKGLSLEPCILIDSENSGKTLDEVCAGGSPFYPQCWPPLSDPSQQEAQMQSLAKDAFPATKEKGTQIMKDVMELMSKANSKSGGY